MASIRSCVSVKPAAAASPVKYRSARVGAAGLEPRGLRISCSSSSPSSLASGADGCRDISCASSSGRGNGVAGQVGDGWLGRRGGQRVVAMCSAGMEGVRHGAAVASVPAASALPERAKVVALVAAVMLLCNADRVVMSVAVVPFAAQYGWSSSFLGIVQVLCSGLLYLPSSCHLFSSPLAHRKGPIRPTSSKNCYSVTWAVMALSGYVAGASADFLIKSGFSIALVRKIMQSIGFIGPGVSLLCLRFAQTPSVAAVLMTIALSLSSFSQAGYFCNVQDIAPKYAGSLHGLTNGIGTMAAIVSTIGTGYFVQWLGSFQDFLTLTAVLYFSATVFYNTVPGADVRPSTSARGGDGAWRGGTHGERADAGSQSPRVVWRWRTRRGEPRADDRAAPAGLAQSMAANAPVRPWMWHGTSAYVVWWGASSVAFGRGTVGRWEPCLWAMQANLLAGPCKILAYPRRRKTGVNPD